MMAHLAGAGWAAADDPADAELIIVNSCGFIESAKRESLDAVFSWRRLFPEKKIMLAGCLAQRYEAELAESLPEADYILGNMDLSRAASVLAGGGLLPDESAEALAARPLLSGPGSAYVKILEGCNNRCAFCAIPLIRGRLQSRPAESIVSECRGLLARGVRELCLIGQDIASYGLDFPQHRQRLPELIEAILRLEGDFWLRLLYIHPERFPPELLDLCLQDKRLLPYFDLPFQHASEPLLRAMNRRGSAEAYLGLIAAIREKLPQSAIRSTFLVGFPGESDAGFAALLDFQEKACLEWAGVFTFSREEGTPAFSMKGRVPKKVMAARKRLLEDRQEEISGKRMERFVGLDADILVEEDMGDALYLGRCAAQAPEVDGSVIINSEEPLQPGTFVRGRLAARVGLDLEAVLQ
jgi:ribosomal protein S12 methylthiotransferase